MNQSFLFFCELCENIPQYNKDITSEREIFLLYFVSIKNNTKNIGLIEFLNSKIVRYIQNNNEENIISDFKGINEIKKH